jgi:phosphomannomutase
MSFEMSTTVAIRELMLKSDVKFGTSGIRGLVSEMSNELCYAYTLAFAQVLKLAPNSEVAIAVDLRPSSLRIATACNAALTSLGIKTHYFGSIPTPAVAFYAEQHQMPAIMVTGSHIPFDRNGIKFYSAEGEITKAHELAITNALLTYSDPVFTTELPKTNPASKEAYSNRYLNFFPKNFLAETTVAFYQHSSVARDLISELLTQLGAKVIALGRTESFVPIDTEAVSQEDVEQAKTWANENEFDVIISTDGDGDRPLIGDENGQWLRGDIVGLLTSEYLGINALATPVSCNTAIELTGAFQTVKRTRIGSPYVIEAIKALESESFDKIAGFEANGGYILATNIMNENARLEALCTRDAVLPILAVIALSKQKQCKISALMAQIPNRVTASDRVKDFPIEKSNELILEFINEPHKINRLLTDEIGSYASIDTTDGLRITLTNNDIVHFRPSGNAPELRCYAESNTNERAHFLVNTALKVIVAYANKH